MCIPSNLYPVVCPMQGLLLTDLRVRLEAVKGAIRGPGTAQEAVRDSLLMRLMARVR